MPPRPVTIAVRLLYVYAALPVINVVLRAAWHANDRYTVLAAIVLPVLSVLLAYYVGQGKKVARIIVWVYGVGTPIVLANSIAAAAGVGGGAVSHPGWYYPFLVTTGVLSTVLLTPAAILLARPAARPYFRVVTPDDDRSTVH
jgi:hypothetical protein